MSKKAPKRKKLTENMVDDILSGKLAIWIWVVIDNNERPMQMIFPGKPTLHKTYPRKNSYFECPNADDKFYFKEFDYFWFVCKNVPPKEGVINRTPDEYDDALANPESMPGREDKFKA